MGENIWESVLTSRLLASDRSVAVSAFIGPIWRVYFPSSTICPLSGADLSEKHEPRLLQLRVLCFGLPVDGNVGIGVFPIA